MEDKKDTTIEQPAKKVEKVVSGPVKIKKKTEVSKFKDIFISDDAANVKNYILMDILVPAVKKAVKDIVTNGIEMILYGETGRSKSSSSANYVSYNRFADDRYSSRRSEDLRARTGYSYDDIIFQTRGDAEKVLMLMDEAIDKYNNVSVADLYDWVGMSCAYTDNKYGWTNLRNADIVRSGDGYVLKLPRVIPLN